MNLVGSGFRNEIDIRPDHPSVVSRVPIVDHRDALHFIGAQAIVGGSGLVVVSEAVQIVHAVDGEHIGVTGQAEGRKVAPSGLGVHHHARRYLCDIGQVLAGIGYVLDLLFVKVGRDVPILGLERSFCRFHFHRSSRRCNGELRICRCGLSDSDCQRLFPGAKSAGIHVDLVAAGRNKVEVVGAVVTRGGRKTERGARILQFHHRALDHGLT